MKRDIYVYTGKQGEVVRTATYTKGNIHVQVDFNAEREVVGVEVIDATALAVDGNKA